MPEPNLPVVFAASAREDIASIFEYLCEHASSSTAEDIFAQIFDAIERLSRFPESGAPRDHVRSHYRMVPVSSWAVWYRYQPQHQEVRIVRVLHGHMDAERRLL